MSGPGATGERARALAVVVNDAARASGVTGEQLVGPSARSVCSTSGPGRPILWRPRQA